MCSVWCVEEIGLNSSYKSVLTELVLTRVLAKHIALCCAYKLLMSCVWGYLVV